MFTYIPIADYIRNAAQFAQNASSITLDRESDELESVIEKSIIGFCHEALGLEDITPQSSLFDLGGDSLMAAELSVQVRYTLGIDLDLEQIFDIPTIRELAHFIYTSYRQHHANDLSILPQRQTQKDREILSFPEARMYFLSMLEPDQPAYNVNGYVCTEGCDLKILEQSFNYVIERHAILRATYDQVDGKPLRIISAFKPYTLPIVDLTTLPEPEREDHSRFL